jgi:ADP-ribosylglycohydrolase
MLSHWDRIEGGIIGLLVGDALGVPYEFHSAANIPEPEAIEMRPPKDFMRAHKQVAPGTWSDDGAQALCLLASLLEKGRFDLDDFARRLVGWYQDGEMAVGGVVYDVGIQTERALHALIEGIPPSEAGPREERANGNGSLMRVLPLALWHGVVNENGANESDEVLVQSAHAQSIVTHAHPRSQACCALYCLWARAEIEGARDPWDTAVGRLRRIYQHGYPAHALELVDNVLPGFAAPRGTGYVVDCVHSAHLACEGSSYEDIVKRAVRLGNDTDTTACVAGGIAGVRYGVEGIPLRWREALRGREIVTPLLDRLRARMK